MVQVIQSSKRSTPFIPVIEWSLDSTVLLTHVDNGRVFHTTFRVSLLFIF